MSFGSKAGCSEQELARSVQQLRERISDVIESHTKFDCDLYLIQWLKRQQFKVDRTETVIRESIEWRKENDIDSLAKQDIHSSHPGISAELVIDFNLQTKSGQPVLALNGDNLDFARLIKKYGKENVLRYFFHLYAKAEEMMIKQIQKIKDEHLDRANQNTRTNSNLSGKEADKYPTPIVGFIAIGTFKDFSIWNAKSSEVISTMFETAKAGVRYFPCFASSVYLINTNKFLAMVFRLFKPIITSQAYTVDFYDCDQSKWSTVLTEDIGLSQLTSSIGGFNKTIEN